MEDNVVSFWDYRKTSDRTAKVDVGNFRIDQEVQELLEEKGISFSLETLVYRPVFREEYHDNIKLGVRIVRSRVDPMSRWPDITIIAYLVPEDQVDD